MKLYRELLPEETLYEDMCKAISNVYKRKHVDLTTSIDTTSIEALNSQAQKSKRRTFTAALSVLEKLYKDTESDDDIITLVQIHKIYIQVLYIKHERITLLHKAETDLCPILDEKIRGYYSKMNEEEYVDITTADI